jgi:hypothetical protein
MLVKALQLRGDIDIWFRSNESLDESIKQLQLSDAEGGHVKYLIVLLRLFAFWTYWLSGHSGPTINKAWVIYSHLFEHLEKYDPKLRQKKEVWKRHLADCVGAAHAKLAKYYSKTAGQKGRVYNFACILDPARKLSLYHGPGFQPSDASAYEEDFRSCYAAEYALLNADPNPGQSNNDTSNCDLDSLVEMELNSIGGQQSGFKELDEYHESVPTRDRNPLLYWQNHSASPGVAQMAKDYLAIPISGVGVERCFSRGRLMCPYQRNQLLPETMKRLMILRHHWGLARKEKAVRERDKAKEKGADRESYCYGKKDFSFALKLDISDSETEDLGANEPPAQATTKNSSGRARKRKA